MRLLRHVFAGRCFIRSIGLREAVKHLACTVFKDDSCEKSFGRSAHVSGAARLVNNLRVSVNRSRKGLHWAALVTGFHHGGQEGGRGEEVWGG